MTDLVERLEGAAAGSRELDAEVIVALRLGCMTGMPDDLHYLSVPRKDDECAPGAYWFHQRSGASLRTAEPVTTSIDAAVALAERVLPGCYWLLGKGRNRPDEPLYGVQIMKGEAVNFVDAQDVAAETEAATPALALCAAIIRAHAEQKEG